MKPRVALIFATFVLCATITFGQKPSQPPKPGPEVAKLGYFLGDWKLDADMKLKRSGPAVKFSGTTHNEWMAGGFFLVGQAGQDSADPQSQTLTVFGYDPEEKTYTSYAFNNAGQIERAKGTVDENTWTWNSERKLGGEVLHSRLVIQIVSPTSYKFKSEIAYGQDGWSTVMEGQATKTK